ncbi:hypothetical protein BXZ70DRAFT_1005886 [Cristinia sonorae]|uniref:DUF6533 domain-containing protein n=1 Tax=Cristinia sonorae TaxID=1940300 RepID=A0A8K0XS83_9AGAR|nr:hypothetical protein BXZ70DRAFT_1005886 [Cristinia sonorae]
MDAATISQLRFNFSCNVAATAIVIFDYFLTFSREVRCLWKRKASVATVIFILERYAIICLGIMRMYPSKMDSLGSCKAHQIASQAMTILVISGIGLFTAFRSYAITGKITVMVILVFLCGMFAPAANIYNFARPREYVYDRDMSICYVRPTAEAIRKTPTISMCMPILVRSITILGDVLVLAVTWNKSYGVYRESLRLRNFRPKIAIMLLRDGTLYFVALAALNLVVLLLVIFGLLLDKNGGTPFIVVSDAVATALIARFVLNLRTIASGEANASEGDVGRASTLHFATATILGNLAAPLHTSFVARMDMVDDSSASGSDSDRGFEMAKDPFAIGLEEDHGMDTPGSPECDVPLHDMSKSAYSV